MASGGYLNLDDFLLAERMALGDMILAHDRQFIVPLNQRPWAWKDAKNVQPFLHDFWNTLTAFFAPDSTPKWKRRKSITHPPHFFGTFVFYERSAKEFEIFDGQQRMTAVTMLCAILREIAFEQKAITGPHQNQASDLYGGFNEWLKISPTDTAPRLLPNTLFRGLFDALIFDSLTEEDRRAAIEKLPQDVRDHVISKKLISSFGHIRRWIHEKTNTGAPAELTAFLLASHDVLRYLFSCIETRILDEQYAYEVFGCLNARGENLTAADNIKNELFKVADHPLHKSISDTWNRIGENVPGQDIGEYLRRRHIALIAPCKQRETYNQLKTEEIDKVATKTLVSSWHQDSRVVRQILHREASFANKETLERLEIIFDVLNVGLAYIPLLAAAKTFLPGKKDDFHECVRLVEIFVFRTLTIGQMDTAELERKLGEAARKLWNEGTASAFKAYLKSQIDDIRFETQFAKHSERRAKIQYYILRELEIHLMGGGKGVIPGNHHSAKNNIEHVLPRRPSHAQSRKHEWTWARTNPEKHLSLVNRLGNLLILESDINRSVGDHEFTVKQDGQYKKNKSGKVNQIKCYKDSALQWPAKLCNASIWAIWTDSEIEARQKDMTKDALKIWAI